MPTNPTPTFESLTLSGGTVTGVTNAVNPSDVVPFQQTFVASGASAAAGLVPSPGTTAGTLRFLREDATWNTTPLPPVFVASGASAAAGLVPSPGTTAGSTRFLREDATWDAPPGGGGVQHLPPSLGANYSFAANCTYPQGGVGANVTSGYATFVPFIVDRSVSVTQLGFWYDSTNSNTVYVGIYSDAGNTPGTLLVSGSVAASAAQQYAVSVTSTTLSAGTLYWAAILLPTTTSTVLSSNAPIFSLGSYLVSGSASGYNQTYTTRVQTSSASLPATAAASSLGSGPFPLIFFNG